MVLTLLEHQRRTIRHAKTAYARGSGLLLFHIMGSGKTVTALAICQALFPDKPIDVYCPVHIKETWSTEHASYFPNARVTVVSHEALFTKKPDPESIVILDEAHHLFDMVKKDYTIYEKLRTYHCAYLLTGTPFRRGLNDISLYVNIVSKKNIVPRSLSEYENMYVKKLTSYQQFFNNWVLRNFWSRLVYTIGSVKLLSSGSLSSVPGYNASKKVLLTIVLSLFISITTTVFSYTKSTDIHKLVAAVRNYVSVVIERDIQHATLRFPDVVRTTEAFMYTTEQTNRLVGILKKEDGRISNINLDNMYGSNANAKYRNAMANIMSNKLATGGSRGRQHGDEIGRVSGYWSSKGAVPNKILYIVKMCQTRKRIVIYSSFGHVARRIAEYLVAEGFSNRVYNAATAYPNIDMKSIQAGFLEHRDIIIMHPSMTEGISIKGVSTMILTEPLTNAAIKQQVEARVVRIGSHKNMKNKRVEIVTCVTGLNMDDITEGQDVTLDSVFLRMMNEFKARGKLAFGLIKRWKELIVRDPFTMYGDIAHLIPGPEVLQFTNMRSLDNDLNRLKMAMAMPLHRIQKDRNNSLVN
jgi:hypothetical protein